MHLLLFIFYSIIACYLLRRMRFFRDSGLKPSVLLLLFALRVAAGCLHNFVAWRFFPNHGDIWAFFQDSSITRQELFHDFPAFIADNSTWAYMPYNVVVLLHVIFNFFSFSDLYINTLFFSFGVFAGSIALFRAFRGFFGNDLLCALCTLLIPSTLFWTACVYKEGLIYLSLGFFFYYLHLGLTGGWNKKRLFFCLFFFGLAVFFRDGLVVSLLPALVLWALLSPSHSQDPNSLARPPFLRNPVRLGLTAALSVIIIIMGFVKPAFFSGILSYVSAQQLVFQSLNGNSRIDLPLLEPTSASFVHTLPAALQNGFFQPLPGSGGQSIYLIFSIELLLIWGIIVFAIASLLRRWRNPIMTNSASLATSPGSGYHSTGFTAFCLAFSLSGMLLVGYIVPFAGAIVRYRSLYLPFLLAPFVHHLRRQPFFQRLNDRFERLIMSNEVFLI